MNDYPPIPDGIVVIEDRFPSGQIRRGVLTKDAARLIGVDLTVMQRWIQQGKVSAWRLQREPGARGKAKWCVELVSLWATVPNTFKRA